jgi:hypothetical protein
VSVVSALFFFFDEPTKKTPTKQFTTQTDRGTKTSRRVFFAFFARASFSCLLLDFFLSLSLSLSLSDEE